MFEEVVDARACPTFHGATLFLFCLLLINGIVVGWTTLVAPGATAEKAYAPRSASAGGPPSKARHIAA